MVQLDVNVAERNETFQIQLTEVEGEYELKTLELQNRSKINNAFLTYSLYK